MKKAIVFGATGLIGEALMTLLDRAFYEEIIVVVRKASPLINKLKNDQPQLYKIIESEDLFSLVFSDSLAGADIYCALGTTIKTAKTQENFRKVDHDLVLNLIQKAKAQGATNLVLVSSAGASSRSKVFYSKVKGEVEDEIQKMNFSHFYLLRPSLLLGDRSEFRLGEKIMRELSFLYSPLMIGGLAQYRPIRASDVAKCMVMLMKGLWQNKIHPSGGIENRELQTMSANSPL